LIASSLFRVSMLLEQPLTATFEYSHLYSLIAQLVLLELFHPHSTLTDRRTSTTCLRHSLSRVTVSLTLLPLPSPSLSSLSSFPSPLLLLVAVVQVCDLSPSSLTCVLFSTHSHSLTLSSTLFTLAPSPSLLLSLPATCKAYDSCRVVALVDVVDVV